MGRKVKFDRQCQERFLGGLLRGLTRSEAAKMSGVTLQTVRNHCELDPSFKSRMEEAQYGADDAVTNALFKKAVAGDVRAQIFWLTNRRPDYWHKDGMAPKEVSLAVETAEPIAYTRFTPEQWSEILGYDHPEEGSA